jgi:hypothetical protein
VEDPELHQSRRLLGLPLVILEPPPPPLRQKLDQQGSFKATGLQTIVPEKLLEESIANLGSVETPTTDTCPSVIVPIQFYEHLSVPHTVMEPNAVTSSGNSSIPTTVATTGEASPNFPSSVRVTTVSAATTLHSGLTPSIVAATTLFTPSVTGPPFSYGMPSSGTSPAITYSTLQTLGLGAWSSRAPLQGQLGGIPIPFNAFPYIGGHISPSSPSLGGLHQQSAEQPAHMSSVVEDLSQTPCAMSALEVLQSCPTQRKALLIALGSTETCNLSTIMLDTTNLKPRLPYHVVFQIVVAHPTKTFTRNIFHKMVDEGASTCVMSLACWKAIGHPALSPSPTLLTAFDGHSFRPHGIFPSFSI